MHPLIQEIDKLNLALAKCRFKGEVAYVYNPLEYAIEAHLEYLNRFGTGQKRVLFLGMNPGPYGMVQTGVPFGEVAMVKDWMGINEYVGQPSKVHPKRPVDGFECQKSEVSGRRLWGMVAERYPMPDDFFKDAFVVNYCPLVWMTESGKNITPDKLPKKEMAPVAQACDDHLKALLDYYQAEILVGVGAYAEKQLTRITKDREQKAKIGRMLHPSPASPIANKHWPERAIDDLVQLGVW
jgi:single-strand selective monofunctional uracil DNA glycosylase